MSDLESIAAAFAAEVKRLTVEIEQLREENAALERENDRIALLADPFRVDYWPFDYNWRTVDADGDIVYHKSKDSPVLVGGGAWFSECGDCVGRMHLISTDDYRNSLRARPTQEKQ